MHRRINLGGRRLGFSGQGRRAELAHALQSVHHRSCGALPLNLRDAALRRKSLLLPDGKGCQVLLRVCHELVVEAGKGRQREGAAVHLAGQVQQLGLEGAIVVVLALAGDEAVYRSGRVLIPIN